MKIHIWIIAFIFLAVILALNPVYTAAGTVTTIQPSTKDAYVVQNNPTLNTGTNPEVFVSRDSNGDELQSLVEFSMSSIPTGATINSALFGLEIDNNIFNTNIRMRVCRVTSSWTETGVTWNNRPSVSTSGCVTADSGTADSGFIEWSVPDMVDEWVNDGELNEGFHVEHILGGSSQGTVEFFSREFVTDAFRPRLIVDYTFVAPAPSWLVYLAGGLTNLTTEVGATGTEFNVIVENTGNVELNFVNLQLYDHTPAVVRETNLTNVGIDELRNHQFVLTHGLTEASYSWQLRAIYQSTTEFWNFTLYVGPSGSLTLIFVASSTLQPQQIDTDSTATLIISINNVGGQVVAFRTQATSRSLLVSPTTAQQIILQPGTGDTTEFLLFPQEDGLFFVDALVTPINQTTGAAIGSSFFTRHLLIVRVSSSVTTFSADDIGVTDAILQGKINSLGGFDSATVYFTFWRTGTSVDNAFIVPPNKQVVSFVSDFRVWVGDLVPETQYSYEFRMQVGPVANPTTFFGGIVNFTTTASFSDPFTGARNGLAEFLGIDSISMGVILGTLGVLFSIVVIALVAGDRLEGMAQTLAIGLGGFSVAAIFFSIGYLPLWVLVFLAVIMAAVIIGLPTFQKGAAANE